MNCQRCGRARIGGLPHSCPPLWQVRYAEGYGDEPLAETFGGYDAQVVALEAAERYYAAWDYPRELTIEVRMVGRVRWTAFLITVEMTPQFRAVPITRLAESV